MKNVIKDLAASSAVSWGTIAEKIDENFSELENSIPEGGEGGSGLDESQLSEYLTKNEYAKKSDIPSVPTKLSEFENDLNFKTINGLPLIGNGNINIQPSGSGVSLFTITLDSDEVCDYYAIDSSGEAVSATGYGCTSFIPCHGCALMSFTNMQLTSAKTYGLAFYDKDKKFLKYIPSLVGSKVESVMQDADVPENAFYFKASYFNYETQKSVGDWKCTMVFTDESTYTKDGKRPYQDGCIYYSQRVNQSITSYWSESQDIAVGDDKKVTTGVLTLPTNYSKDGRKVPLILYAHGLSHYVHYGQWGASDRPTFMVQKQHWLDMGFAIMDCNGARDNNKKGQFASGICPQGVNAYKLCLEYVLQNYNIDPDIFIVAGSAGGAVGWNFLSMYGKCVKAAVFISAYANMKSDAYGGGNQKNLYVEYLGFNNASIFEDEKTIGFDPVLKIVTINSKKYCFDYYNTPIYGLYGSLDTYNLVTSQKNMFAALRNAGATAQLRKIEGVGHEIVSGGNIAVDAEVGNWLLSHFKSMDKKLEIVYHSVTYNYVDENGTTIKDSVTSNVIEGVTIDFTANAPSIVGYNYVSVNPTSATITSDIIVVYTYKKAANTYTITYQYKDANGNTIKANDSEAVVEGTSKDFTTIAPSIAGYEFASVSPTSSVVNSNITVVFTYNVVENEEGGEVVGNDLTPLFTWDRQGWMATKEGTSTNNFKSSSNFMSCFADLSAYIGKTIRVTVPQYTSSAGSYSTGRTMWFKQPYEDDTHFYSVINEWDMDTHGNGKGILVEVETVVPAEAPYMWTSTYMDGVAAYVGPNSGATDFRCYVVDDEGDDNPDVKTHSVTYQYKDVDGNVIKEEITSQVMEGEERNFVEIAPTINGYDFVSAEPTEATITSDIIVVFTYKKKDTEVEGNDLSSLFTFDRKNWMCVSNPQFKTSSYFDSGFTDLSAYIGKTIRITVPQYTASNGASSTGITFWTATPTEQPASVDKSLIIKQWDIHDAGNAKGILVEIETVVPENAPYIWTSTYNDNAVSSGVYVGENDGYTDFKCYIIE